MHEMENKLIEKHSCGLLHSPESNSLAFIGQAEIGFY